MKRTFANYKRCIFYLLFAAKVWQKKLALMAMDHAREMGFKRCYTETTAFLTEAIALYEHLGFQHIDYALGCTGHVDCEVRMLRDL